MKSGKKQISIYKFFRLSYKREAIPVKIYFESGKEIIRAFIYRNFIYVQFWHKEKRSVYMRYDCGFENHKEFFMYYEDRTVVAV